MIYPPTNCTDTMTLRDKLIWIKNNKNSTQFAFKKRRTNFLLSLIYVFFDHETVWPLHLNRCNWNYNSLFQFLEIHTERRFVFFNLFKVEFLWRLCVKDMEEWSDNHAALITLICLLIYSPCFKRMYASVTF